MVSLMERVTRVLVDYGSTYIYGNLRSVATVSYKVVQVIL